MCASGLAVEYIDHISLGHEDEAEEAWSKYIMVKSKIDMLKSYVAEPKLDTNKVKTSDKGRFSLKENQKSISLDGIMSIDPSLVNCLSEEEICQIVNSLKLICNC
jgi:hypothetical protein